jgi:hypothetical protein
VAGPPPDNNISVRAAVLILLAGLQGQQPMRPRFLFHDYPIRPIVF